MNKQPTTIRTYLLRGAFLLSLAFVIVMPLALGQTRSRGSQPSVAAAQMPQVAPPATGAISGGPAVADLPASQLPKTSSGPAGAHRVQIPPVPQFPQVVLYDQYNNAGANATSSQDFEPAFDAFDDELADDFVVPGGQSWSVETVDADGVYFNGPGPAASFNVRFYSDSAGLPGALVASRIGMSYVQVGSTFTVTLSPAVSLTAGTYWVSVQARQDDIPFGQWGWTDRTVQSNQGAAWQDPGGGFGVCMTWGRRGDPAGCNIDPGVPDQVYRLNGTIGGPTPTPTPTPPCSWSAGPDLNPPSGGVRLVGVFFPANGKFYGMGGRSSDSAGSDFMHPFEYDPSSNSWTTKSATYPDAQVNNMACGVLTESGTPYIYCVGGSQATFTTATARVFRYNPATDTITTLTGADNWPGDVAGTILPGGFSVLNNKLYILGGFDINVASTNQIWQFDPTAGVGSKWTQMVNTPEGVMYAPTTTIGNIIYLAGASDFSGGLVIDTTNSFSFNPGTNTIGATAPIPRATGETRALNFNGQMYVMGGGRVAPNPSNEVDIYDPGSNTWSTGIPFVNARRNFPTDTDGTNRIWLAGGYAPTTPTASMEIFTCATPTPTPTPTPGQIHLTAKGHIVNGNDVVRLRWTGANSPKVDIRRDGVKIATVANTGSYTDTLTVHGIYTYQVCEKGTMNCSNEVRVRFLP